jgi:Flp pilus assembly pilin Flp
MVKTAGMTALFVEKRRSYNMNTFLQEYGVIIVAVLVTLAMVGIAVFFGNQVQEGITTVLNKFMKLVADATPSTVH